MKRIAVVTVGLLIGLASPASASHKLLHDRPQGPATVRFAADFPALIDHEWDFALGGFGGIESRHPLAHVPVIFIHGNVVDHSDWYPVRDAFKAAGWTDQELWAPSYNGIGGNAGGGPNPERDQERLAQGSDYRGRTTNNDLNVPDLYDFIMAVRAYTGSAKFSIVSHSLGVTIARKTLKVHPELRADLVAFVGIAGGNHGTSLCPPGSAAHVHSCDELEADSAWLADLNGPGGADETYGPATWLTLYDDTGAVDAAYVGPYAQRPRLEGADNRAFTGKHHNALRLDADMIALYRSFLEDAETPYLAALGVQVKGTRQTNAKTADDLPATGAGTRALLATALLALAAAATLMRRRLLA